MDEFEIKWKCPVCGNMNDGYAVDLVDYTQFCEECHAECEVNLEIKIRVLSVDIVNTNF